jgi:hypothetical protein
MWTLAAVSTNSNSVLLVCLVLSNATNPQNKKNGLLPVFFIPEFNAVSEKAESFSLLL